MSVLLKEGVLVFEECAYIYALPRERLKSVNRNFSVLWGISLEMSICCLCIGGYFKYKYIEQML